jgi:hypothetical protein
VLPIASASAGGVALPRTFKVCAGAMPPRQIIEFDLFTWTRYAWLNILMDEESLK